MRLGLLGYGAIARQALAALAKSDAAPFETVVCLARPEGAERARALLDAFGPEIAAQRRVVTDLAGLIAAKPDVVAEAAGHEALLSHGADVLASGVDLIVTSAGALADGALREALDDAARRGGARYRLCAGAIGGLDILAAAKLSGLTEVVYVSRKPPAAWRGTRAEALIDLDALTTERTFFEGSAREAALNYPQNANVAATLAFFGAGFEKTRVRLIADPEAARNTHEILLRSTCADIEIRIAGVPSPDNPKSSMTTGFALAALILEFCNGKTGRQST